MILLTTSLRPTRRIRTFCRDLEHSIAGLIRVNRGKMSLQEVGEKAAELGAEKIVIVDRWKGGIGRIRFFKIGKEGVEMVFPILYVRGTKLRREFGVATKKTRALFMDEKDSDNKEIGRLKESLSRFFKIPIIDTKNVSAKVQTIMRVTVDPSRLLLISFYALPEGLEIGPRITVSHTVWEK